MMVQEKSSAPTLALLACAGPLLACAMPCSVAPDVARARGNFQVSRHRDCQPHGGRELKAWMPAGKTPEDRVAFIVKMPSS
jgi:hypothetical protein